MDSLLTTAHRDYLRGEKDVSSDYKEKLKNRRIPKRIAAGLADMALLSEHIDRISLPRVLMSYSPDQATANGGETSREGWRHLDVHDTIVGALTFLMEIARAFDYGSIEWENWIRKAIRNVANVEYVKVSIDAYSPDQLDRLEDADLSELPNHEAHALVRSGRVELTDAIEAGHDPPLRGALEGQAWRDPLSDDTT